MKNCQTNQYCSPKRLVPAGRILVTLRCYALAAGYPGELMIDALQELVLPLIAFALMVGVLNLRHTTSGTGRITAWSLMYYLMSMVLAVGIAIALVSSQIPYQGFMQLLVPSLTLALCLWLACCGG